MNEIFAEVIRLAQIHANKLRDGAAYGGRWDDDGAKLITDEIAAFQCGLESRLPPLLKRFEEQATRNLEKANKADDPEYKQYLELRKKFKHLDD